MNDSRRVEQTIATGIRNFTRDVGVGRIPYHPQVVVIDGREDTSSLLRGGDIAGVLVFETDDEPVLLCVVSEFLKSIDDAFENSFGTDDPPIGKNADDLCTGELCDFESALRKLRLIFE